VEPAREIGADGMERVWSRHSQKRLAAAAAAAPGTAGATKRAPGAVSAAGGSVGADGGRLAEYLALRKGARATATWVNDDHGAGDVAGSGKGGRKGRGAAEAPHASEHGDGDARGDGHAPAAAPAAHAGSGGTSSGGGGAGGSDLDFLRSKVVRTLDEEDDDSEEEGEEGDDDGSRADGEVDEAGSALPTARPPPGPPAPAAAAVAPPPLATLEGDADVGETGRLFVRNLPFTATEEEVRSHFATWGRLADVRLLKDAKGASKGYGYVTFVVPERAVTALAAADARPFQGRILHVIPARPEPKPPAEEEGGGGAGGGTSSFKRKREEERKAAAGSAHERENVWNSLFIRGDTTLAATAAALNVREGEVLDREGGNMAVRLALAETRLIADTKAFLLDNGVALPAFEAGLAATATASGAGAGSGPAVARSDTVVLVKSLPFDADAAALRSLFARHGVVTRFVLPPSRAIGIVELADARQAK
jgi:multiple RNA-binding domain-containing protein 1